ncbi:MAG: SRPBCC domain-containing protein [Armatimonadota bacterium]|jgi:uncharacterized protein YndB with AHSA1/START domain
MSNVEFVVDRENLEVVQKQVIDAPRERVWDAMVDPALVPQWWGPAALTTGVEQMDVREGGTWRYVQRDREGHEYAFSGVYRTVEPPGRLEYSFTYEGEPDDLMEETATLEELPGGRTVLTTRSRFATVEALDGAVSSGMEEGATESMERFADLIERR